MSLWILLPGSFGLMMLGVMLFMLAAFGGGGAAAGAARGSARLRMLDAALFVLPGSCAVALIMLWVGYFTGHGSGGYWWFAFPAPFAVLYIVFLASGFKR